MNRRNFLRDTGMAAAGLYGFSILNACTGSPISSKGTPVTGANESFVFEEWNIADLRQRMESGELTARAIVEKYLDRIGQIDKAGPALNSVIELNHDALSIADQLDAERKQNKVRGPLHGIPVMIKDNIDTADKMMNTAGSIAMEGNLPEKDAVIVAQLREAGAIIIAKTNLSEWANFRSTRSSSGWSSRGGQTKNPYVLDRSPCGSSSGSGAAVAANLCAVAIGTETNGSISCPASINGVVGIKPTVGLWSRTGIIPISVTQDTAGPLGRTVYDAAALLGPLSGVDMNDPAMKDRPDKVHPDYTVFLKEDGLQGKIIGVEKSFLKGHEGIDALLQRAIEQMKEKGATIVEVDLRERLKDTGKDEYELLKFEFKDGLNKYLASAKGKVKSLEELISFNKENEKDAMPFFRQEILEQSQEMESVSGKKYQETVKRLLDTTRKAFTDVFTTHKLNAVCGPANGPSWCIDLVNGDFFTGYGMYSPAAIAGYPSITVPLGRVAGLPVGLSFLGLAYAEPELLAIAYAYEQASRNRVPPVFTHKV
jgi:amidase